MKHLKKKVINNGRKYRVMKSKSDGSGSWRRMSASKPLNLACGNILESVSINNHLNTVSA